MSPERKKGTARRDSSGIGRIMTTNTKRDGGPMIEILKSRFDQNMMRHPDLVWETVEERLHGNPEALEALRRMEESGGEPDTIGVEEATGKLIFCDCSKETPSGRRSLCYDDEALQKRKKNPPAGSAVQQAEAMGVSLLTEELYRRLQDLGLYDQKTSSWIATPDEFCAWMERVCHYLRIFGDGTEKTGMRAEVRS